jgi:beta-glucuronidase
LEPDQYYFVAEDQPSSEQANDAPRQAIIREQMDVFRTKPFVAGAIFWSYAGMMGVVDEKRQRRESWAVLRDEYSPVCFESVKSTFLTEGSQRTTIRLRARGPLESDLPVYTLRGYRLQWQATSSDKIVVFAQGEIPLPELLPSCAWSGELVWNAPPKETILTVSIVRPGGHCVLECSYDPWGDLPHG